MICKVCGRTITNEDANFCEYCGTSFRPGTDNRISEESANFMNNTFQQAKDDSIQFNGYQQTTAGQMNAGPFQQDGMPGQNGYGNNQGKGMPGQNGYGNNQGSRQVPPLGFNIFSGSDRPMTFGNWIIIYLLPFIPVVGFVFFLVLLFSWGFGANTAPTKKNWARATLVMLGVLLIMFSVMLSSGYLGDPTAILNNLYGNV